MIDLERSRDDLLESIGAGADLFERPPIDPRSPALCSVDEAHFEVRAHTRDEILPLVRSALQRRFDWVSEGRLFHDLFLPLKRGLGNAFKRGNAANAGKWLRARVAVTRRGAFIEIRDEGEGFDVEDVLARFRSNERYFTHGGAGFDTLERSMAAVSYADGGRTLLIGYGCPPRDEQSGGWGGADEERFMHGVLQEGLPMLKKRRGTLESLQIVEPRAPRMARRRELGYALRYRDAASGRAVDLALTGRVLDPEAAQTDYAVARTLARGPFRKVDSPRIPRPLSAFKSQPRVVFYPFESTLAFEALLEREPQPNRLNAIEQVARGLRTWHECGLKPIRSRAIEPYVSQQRSAVAAVSDELEAARPGSSTALGEIAARLEARAGALATAAAVPIHGRFGFDTVLHDGQSLVFYEFEHACGAHPGFDLAGFLADLEVRGAFLARDFRAQAAQAFLAAYGTTAWASDLPFFIALTALQRLEESVVGNRPEETARWSELAQSTSPA